MGEWAAKEEQAAYYRRLHEITRVDRCGGPVESPAGEASSASGDDSTISIPFRVEIVSGTPIEGDVFICFCDALSTNPLLRGEA